MNLIKSLEWRYASKKMNGKPVPQQKVDNILQAIQLAPSSMGLQPFTVLVITNPEVRKKIVPIAYHQTQIAECSHLLVFATWKNITPAHIDDYIEHISNSRNMKPGDLQGFKDMLLGKINTSSAQELFEWAARQTYIAFGTAIAAAAEERVDATPMEGFNPAALDELLNLNEKGLRSVTLLPLGYRDTDNDRLATLPKVRRQKEKLFIVQ